MDCALQKSDPEHTGVVAKYDNQGHMRENDGHTGRQTWTQNAIIYKIK
jgi:hypothetical protein